MKLPKNLFMQVLALIVVILTFGMIAVLQFRPLIQENKELLYTVFGIMLGWAGTIITYYWGSSKSSNDKTELMNGGKEPGNSQ